MKLPAIVAGTPRGSARTRDVSYQGLSLTMDEPPPLNQFVRVRIELPGKTLAVHAVVVRVLQVAGTVPTVGLRLFAMNGPDKVEWDAFVTGLLRTSTQAAA